MTSRKLPFLLAALLTFALLTAWVTGAWAVHLLRAGVFAVGAAWLIEHLRSREPVRLHAWLVPPLLTGLLGIGQIATGHTIYPWLTVDAALGWLGNTTFLFLALQTFSGKGERDRWLRGFVHFGLGLCVFSVLQLYTSDAKVFWTFVTPRSSLVMGTLGYKNHYAAFVELLFPVAIWVATLGRNRVIYITIAAIVAATTVAAVSRSGVGLVALEFIVCVAVLRYQGVVSSRSAALMAMVFGVVSAAFVGVFGWESFWAKLHATGDVRNLIYTAAIEMIRERPWAGFGLGTWTTAYPAYACFDEGLFVNAAHNDWLQWAGDGGLPSALLLLVLAVSSLRPALKSVWGIGVPVLFLQAVIDFPFQLPALAVLQFTFLGVLASQGYGPTSNLRNNTLE